MLETQLIAYPIQLIQKSNRSENLIKLKHIIFHICMKREYFINVRLRETYVRIIRFKLPVT